MKFKLIIEESEGIAYMKEKELVGYAKASGLRQSQDGYSAMMYLMNKGLSIQKIPDTEYYIGLAKDELGSASRDNRVEELIEIGRKIELGEWESY